MSKVLFLSKTTLWGNHAEAEARKVFGAGMIVCRGDVGDAIPEVVKNWSGQTLISFLSPWVIPANVLVRVSNCAVNFHPGPPEYPGIGCYNFALYDGVKTYGVTAHHMSPKVDTGMIIAVRSFMIDEGETVWSLKEKSMRHMLDLFKEVVADIAVGRSLKPSGLLWARRPYTRKELNGLCELNQTMSREEVTRRVCATTFPGAPGAWLQFHGYRFEYAQDRKKE